jgi:hypothetical protein
MCSPNTSTLEAMRTQGTLIPMRHDVTQRSKLHESNWQIAIWLFGRLTRAVGSALFSNLFAVRTRRVAEACRREKRPDRKMGNGEWGIRRQSDLATGRRGDREHQHHRIFLSLCRPVAPAPPPPVSPSTIPRLQHSPLPALPPHSPSRNAMFDGVKIELL